MNIRGHEFTFVKNQKNMIDEKMNYSVSKIYNCGRCNKTYPDFCISERMDLCSNIKVQESTWTWFKGLFK